MHPVIHIVDDDAAVRAALSYQLRSRGYASEIYAGGEEFLGEARLGVGCVLLDLRMPQMDGFSVQAELASRAIFAPVIMMTGHGDVPSAVKALTRGAIDFIEKPFSDEMLFQSVERAVAISLDRYQGTVRHEKALTLLSCLSARELEILRGLVAGMTNKEMARALNLSHRTVEMHRANMMRDLGCVSVTQVIRLALEADIKPLLRAGVNQSEAAGFERHNGR